MADSPAPPAPSNPVLEAALAYAALGFRVVPPYPTENGDCTCNEYFCDLAGRHFSWMFAVSASTDTGQLHRWFSGEGPIKEVLNFGISTGAKSGLLGLEIVRRKGGIERLAAVEEAYGKLPPTAVVASENGDRCYLFRHPDVPLPKVDRYLARGMRTLVESDFIFAPPCSAYGVGTQTWLRRPELGLAPPPWWFFPWVPPPPPPPTIDFPGLPPIVPATSPPQSLGSGRGEAPLPPEPPLAVPPGPARSTRCGLAALGGEALRLGRARSGAGVRLAAAKLWRLVDRGALTLHDLRSGLLVAGRIAGLADPVTLRAIEDGLRIAEKRSRRRSR